MEGINKESAFYRAQHRVDRLRGFYNHLAVYLLINIGITTYKIIRNVLHGETINEAFFDLGTFIVWGLWGIGLAIHAFSVFGLPFLFGKNWEEEKIKQFIEEEEKYKI